MTTDPVDGLHATIALRRGSLELEIDVHAEAGEVVALLGPNGAGKTTLLRCLAGLEAIDAGRIDLDGEVLDEPAAGVFVPPERRPVGVVFQDYLLFAHLDALENVAFGLRARGVHRRVARERAAQRLESVGLAAYAPARPRALSGGQQQRVALARALAIEPALLLLDEPLAALDAATRVALRRELRAQLAQTKAVRVLVTHDPLDAYALADRVVILEEGRVTHEGTLAAVAAHPRSHYVAQLLGTNLLSGTITGSTLRVPGGGELVVVADHDGASYAAIAPSAVALYRLPPEGSPRNVWRTTVTDIDRRLDRVRVGLGAPLPLSAELTTAGLAALGCRPGDEVWASVKATEITTYPA
jgi:molybdate transport system ATP-binding protein